MYQRALISSADSNLRFLKIYTNSFSKCWGTNSVVDGKHINTCFVIVFPSWKIIKPKVFLLKGEWFLCTSLSCKNICRVTHKMCLRCIISICSRLNSLIYPKATCKMYETCAYRLQPWPEKKPCLCSSLHRSDMKMCI